MNFRALVLATLVLFSGVDNVFADTAPAFATRYANRPRAAVTILETDNSVIEISGIVPGVVNWVWIKVTKVEGGFKPLTQIFATPAAGWYSKKFHLPFGAGIYNFSVAGSVESSQLTSYYRFFEGQANNHDTRDLSYLTPTEHIESDAPEVVELAKSIAKGSLTDRDKAKAIHDWVAGHIAYDTDSYFAGAWKEKSALVTLHDGKALCSGYADLTAALHRALGIRAKIIGGIQIRSEPGLTWEKVEANPSQYSHAWNQVYVDGKWLTMDTTWDAGGLHGDGKFHFRLSQEFFDPTPDDFALSHRATDESPF